MDDSFQIYPQHSPRYCEGKKSCTSWYMAYPSITLLFTVFHCYHPSYRNWCSMACPNFIIHNSVGVSGLVSNGVTIPFKIIYPLVMTNIAMENGPVEIVDFPIENSVDLSSSQTVNVYQRVRPCFGVKYIIIYP